MGMEYWQMMKGSRVVVAPSSVLLVVVAPNRPACTPAPPERTFSYSQQQATRQMDSTLLKQLGEDLVAGSDGL
ncbi:hypothetical protein Vi05172_g1743 [Venturia inaequalis]|nr:hypothetical protein Vi05172_g1743 [Venturia inaequalis]